MVIFPAIDIKGGKCVRLIKGDFNNITQYEKTPMDQAKEFFDLGFKNIHLIDLDGALEGNPVNENIIKKISNMIQINLQVGGGVRTLDHIEKLISFGVNTVIVGTAAIKDIGFLKTACNKFDKKIAIALDVREGRIALSGWKKQTNILATDFVKEIENINIKRIIYTDINKDGTKSGPNLEETINFSNLTKIPVLVSGGISSINDVINIKNNKYKNIEGIIVGKAIYDGSIDIKKLSKII